MKIWFLCLFAMLAGSVRGDEIWFSITTNHCAGIDQGTEVLSVERCVFRDRMIFSEKVMTPNSTREMVHLNGETFHRSNYGAWFRGNSDFESLKSKYTALRRYIFLEESFLAESQRTTDDMDFAEKVETFVTKQEKEKSALDLGRYYYEAFEGIITLFRDRERPEDSNVVSAQIVNFKIDAFPYSNLLGTEALPRQRESETPKPQPNPNPKSQRKPKHWYPAIPIDAPRNHDIAPRSGTFQVPLS